MLSGIIPNPLVVRTVPTRPTDIVVWLASAPLIGLTLATYGAFAPIQPIIGVASLAFLAGTLAYRLRQIARGCERCVGGAPEA